MKYTMFLTQRCNLACDYCYVCKNNSRMSMEVGSLIIDFAFEHTPQNEEIEIGLFGGEPLLEFPLLTELIQRIEDDTRYDPCRLKLSVTTNGTLLTLSMLEFFRQHNIAVTISCDGPPHIQDRFRHFQDGSRSSHLVEKAILTSVGFHDDTSVNAVYGPQSIEYLSEVVDYLSSLGVREIHLNADFSAPWTETDVVKVGPAYEAVAKKYMQYYRERRPRYISLFDSKITVMLRGGYQPQEKCRMGVGEFAFTPLGQVYPCERLVAAGTNGHSIGRVAQLVQIGPLQGHFASPDATNPDCVDCRVKDLCINWCGCCNYSMTGYYNRVSPFLCASEKASLRLAAEIVETLESELGPTFLHHLGALHVLPGNYRASQGTASRLKERLNAMMKHPHRRVIL